MLNYFPESWKWSLHAFYQRCRLNETLPSLWKQSVIVPILKRGKPWSTIASYKSGALPMSYPRSSLFYEQTTAIGILSVPFLYSSVNVVACTLDGCIPLEAAQKAHNHVLLVGTLSSGVSERERERETKKKKKAENELRVAIWNRDIQHLKRSLPQWLLKLLNTELCHEQYWRRPRSQELCMCVCLVLLPFSLYTRFCVYSPRRSNNHCLPALGCPRQHCC